jgi:hypothetical protein
MTGPEQPADGDYGYDLVHEAGGGTAARPGAPAPQEPAPAQDDGPGGDPGGDFGYDEIERS